MRRFAIPLVLAALGCAKKDSEPKPAPEPAPATRTDAAPARPPILTLPGAVRALTRPVSAAALVVVHADGTIALIHNRETGDLDLTAVAAGTVVPLEQLERQARTMLEAVAEGYRRDAGPDDCRGAVGMGRYGTVTDGGRMHAGLIGYRSEPACHQLIPLVLADARAPATKVIEVLSALTRAELAVAVDGEARARTLPITLDHLVGDAPPLPEDVELGFTLHADGVSGSAYRGDTADDKSWTWRGELGALAQASEQGRAVATHLRLRVDADAPAGALITAITNLLAGGADRIAIGQPVDHAQRYGVGGGSHRPASPVPSLAFGTPQVSGGIEAKVVRRYLKRQGPKLKYCYEKQLLAKPKLEGTVETKFTIAANGTVTSSSASGVDVDVSTCIAGVVQSAYFPKLEPAAPANVQILLKLSPSGG